MEKKFNWNNIKDLPVLPSIPERYDIDTQVLFRTPLNLINHLMWNQLIDYEFYNQINATDETIITLHSYYTGAIFQLKKAYEVAIPPNEDFIDAIKIENKSTLRENSVKQALLENCFSRRINSEELKTYIKRSYKLDNLDQYSDPKDKTLIIKVQEEAKPYERTLVVWIIEMIVGLYREDVEGNISLIGCSDYFYDYSLAVYPNSNIYWSDRIREETEFVKSDSSLIYSLYIPGKNPIKLKELNNHVEKEERKEESEKK